MRKLTTDEKLFLAGVGTTAVVGTIEVTPKVVTEIRNMYHEAPKPTPGEVFVSGVGLGTILGVVLTTKVIIDKVNNP